jgi:hypothetical protein
MYARKDEAYKTELRKALSPLTYNNIIKDFHDGDISPGEEWEDKITEALHNADVILALVSSDFLASDYIQKKEFNAAYERHQNNLTKLMPIIVRSCPWEQEPRLKSLQVLPKDAIPINNWDRQDDAYKNIVESITPILSEINEKRLKEEIERGEVAKRLFEEQEWQKTVEINNLEGYLAYIEKFQPNPRYKTEAHSELKKIRSSINLVLGAEIGKESNKSPFKRYSLLISGVIGLIIGVGISPFGKRGGQVGSNVPPSEPIAWKTTLTKGDIPAYNTYLEKFPDSIHSNAAKDSIAVKNEIVNSQIRGIEGVIKRPDYKNDPVTMNDIQNALNIVFKLDPDNIQAIRLKQEIFKKQ